MEPVPQAKRVQRWLVVYIVSCLFGALLLVSFSQGGALESWNWWQRLLLVVLGSPFIATAYVASQGLLEVLFHAAWFMLRESPLAALVILSVGVAFVSLAFSALGQ